MANSAAASSPTSSDVSQRGLLVVMSGPSGVGKTTIARSLIEQMNGTFSVSATTRPKTEQDVEGKDYFFVDESRFKAMIENGEFLEHAQVFGRHWYGTPRRPVEQALTDGRLVVLDIDVQGALQVRRAMSDAVMVFIEPPSEDELLRRLQDRGRDDEDAIQRRFAEAKREIELAHQSGAYDGFIVNDDVARATTAVSGLVASRRTCE